MSQELQPQSDRTGDRERPLALTPRDATKSRHCRFGLGLLQLVLGLLTGFVAVVNTVMVSDELQSFQAAGERPPGAVLAGLIAIIVCFSMVSIAGVAVGIWNFKTLDTTVRPPLISSIVVSLVSIVLILIFISEPISDPGMIGWVLLHAFVAAWGIGTLRLKKVPAAKDVA